MQRQRRAHWLTKDEIFAHKAQRSGVLSVRRRRRGRGRNRGWCRGRRGHNASGGRCGRSRRSCGPAGAGAGVGAFAGVSREFWRRGGAAARAGRGRCAGAGRRAHAAAAASPELRLARAAQRARASAGTCPPRPACRAQWDHAGAARAAHAPRHTGGTSITAPRRRFVVPADGVAAGEDALHQPGGTRPSSTARLCVTSSSRATSCCGLRVYGRLAGASAHPAPAASDSSATKSTPARLSICGTISSSTAPCRARAAQLLAQLAVLDERVDRREQHLGVVHLALVELLDHESRAEPVVDERQAQS